MGGKSFFKTSVGIFLIGALLGSLLPTPFDAVFFYAQNFLYSHQNELSRSSFLFWQSIIWYFLDSLWEILLILLAWILHIRKVSTLKIITTIGTIIGIGAIVGLILKFVIGY